MDVQLDWDIEPSVVAGRFDEFLDAVERELQTEVDAVVELIASDAQSNAPVDTGELRDSIEAVMEEASELIIRGAIEVGAEHGVYQEFGTIHMPAQPYLAPALDANREELISRSEQAITRAAKQVFG